VRVFVRIAIIVVVTQISAFFWLKNSSQGHILATAKLSRLLHITLLTRFISLTLVLLAKGEIHVSFIFVGLRIPIQLALLVMNRELVRCATIIIVTRFGTLFCRLNLHIVGMLMDLSIACNLASQMSVLLSAGHRSVFPWTLAKLHVIPFSGTVWFGPVVQLTALVLQGELVGVAASILITSMCTLVHRVLRHCGKLVTTQLPLIVFVTLCARCLLFGIRLGTELHVVPVPIMIWLRPVIELATIVIH
jgi:hypothetical protein